MQIKDRGGAMSANLLLKVHQINWEPTDCGTDTKIILIWSKMLSPLLVHESVD